LFASLFFNEVSNAVLGPLSPVLDERKSKPFTPRSSLVELDLL